jgi:SNF2 family DNA or RNA helicase
VSAVVVLDVHPDGRTAIKPPTSRLDAFRKCLQSAGGKFDRDTGGYFCELGQTHALIQALCADGFQCSFAGALAESLNEYQQRKAARQKKADDARSKVADRVRAAGGKLYPFQREGVAWLASRDRGLLADAMGLGKTAQALMAAPPGAPVLVVAPAAVKGVWRDEIRKWRPDFTPTVLKGRKAFRWPKSGECVIVNYAILPAFIKPGKRVAAQVDPVYGATPQGLILIADEAHKVKNGEATRTKRFRAVARSTMMVAGRVWLLTGTPMLGKPIELWSVLKAANLEVEAFGTWVKFCRLFSIGKGPWGQYTWGRPKPQVKSLLANVMLRRLREDVLPDLPEKMEREWIVERIDDSTRRIFNDCLNACADAGVDLTDSTLDVNLANRKEVMKAIMPARTALAACKIKALEAMVVEYEEENEPLVVFADHRAPIDVLAKRDGWATITGDTLAHKRPEIAAKFREGKYRGLAATIESAGVGLTLCGGKAKAAHAVFCSMSFTPALNQQAEDRLHRIGQTRGVMITRLVADHALDRHLTRVLLRKQRLIQATLPTSPATPAASTKP